MKYLLLALGIFFSTIANAQFGFYAQGGGNYSMLRITRTPGVEHGKNGYGWQAGAGVEYSFQNGYFTYLETNFASQNFKKDSTSKGFNNVVTNFTYRPLFVNIPFGFGCRFALSKEVGFKVYSGITTQVGVAGKLTRDTKFYIKDSVTGQPVQVRTDFDKHRINYGRSVNIQSEFQNDLANTIWGFNIGAGLNFSQSVEVGLLYQEGLTNILPGGDGTPEINKLRSLTLNLKIYIPSHYAQSK